MCKYCEEPDLNDKEYIYKKIFLNNLLSIGLVYKDYKWALAYHLLDKVDSILCPLNNCPQCGICLTHGHQERGRCLSYTDECVHYISKNSKQIRVEYSSKEDKIIRISFWIEQRKYFATILVGYRQCYPELKCEDVTINEVFGMHVVEEICKELNEI